MDAILKDKRFARIATDKKFRSAGKKRKKVTIDSRFNSMFKDERFVSKCSVDPRGRPKNFTSKENYRKFYELKGSDESESESSESSSSDADTSTNKQIREVDSDDSDDSDDDAEVVAPPGDDQEEEEDDGEDRFFQEGDQISIDPKIKDKLRNDNVDYARGEANLYSDSSSDESSSDDEDADAEGFDKWGELDKDAQRTDESTRRIAVCNMDWDRVQAEDIFLVLSSFCPSGGCVKSVDIYISDFGKSRLEEEERLGPAELRRLQEEREKIEEDYADIIKSGKRAEKAEKAAMERVREYQVNRLKYYYAVAEFDSSQTANSVYSECDGKEYEMSATRFDLRFVPDDMEFDEKPTSKCHSLPDPAVYKPKSFLTTALQLGKVELTWDEQDAEREQQLKKAYEKLDDENEDFSFAKNLIASSSSEEEEENEKISDKNQKTKKKGKKMRRKGRRKEDKEKEDKEKEEELASDSSDQDEEDEDSIAKYRALLLGINQDDDEDKGLEVTWDQDQEEAASDNQGSDIEEQEKEKELTPWEKYLKKKKDKRDKKKMERKKKMADSDDESEQEEDDLPEGVDLSDPFFAEELADRKKSAKNEKKKKKKKKTLTEDDEGDEDKQETDLALLVMESDDDKAHFNYKTIVEEETKGKSKKKWKKKKKKQVEEEATAGKSSKDDNFQVNVNDERFSAIYNRPEFNIDPSEHNFKKTKGMDNLIDEKQRRAASSGQKQKHSSTTSHPQPQAKKSKLDPELTASLKSVKNKWQKNAKKSKKKAK